MSILLKWVYLFFNVLCIFILCDDLYDCMDVLSFVDFHMWNYPSSDFVLLTLCCLAILLLHLLYTVNEMQSKYFYLIPASNTCVLPYLGQYLKMVDDHILMWIQLNCEAISLYSIAKFPTVSLLLVTLIFYAANLIFFIQQLNRSCNQPADQAICIYLCIIVMFFYSTNLGCCLFLCLIHRKSLWFYALLCFHIFLDPMFYFRISSLYLHSAFVAEQIITNFVKIYCTFVLPWCNHEPHTFMLLTLFLLKCGDIEVNPGPNQRDMSVGIKIQFANIRGLWSN